MKSIIKTLQILALISLFIFTIKHNFYPKISWWVVFSPILGYISIILLIFTITFLVFLSWGIILLFRGYSANEISQKFNKMAKKSPLN